MITLKAPLAAVLVLSVPLLVSCERQASATTVDPTAIVLNDRPVDQRDVATDFATAFALDSSCQSLVLMRFSVKGFRYPEKYWALDFSHLKYGEKPFVWRMIRGGRVATGYAVGSEPSAADAAHSVCSIVSHRGGQVR